MSEFSKLEAIYFAALERTSEQERAAYLNFACDGDSRVRRRIEKMLAACDAGGSFLESPPFAAIADDRDDLPIVGSVAVSEGARIGPYKLLQEIGEGGFGVVYMAEQQEPIHRQVALKIIKPGMDTKEVISRFESERQALALMEHPNIAKVLDAGTTAAGHPYFVMELVKGVPLTTYCDQQQLTLQQRMELFVAVCQAIQHAHQKGIIHRDIKPTNVLVARYDDTPVPKVIDFGVAKATTQKLTDKTMFTRFGQLIGTLEYMSPEQAQLNQLDIDTRSDIYSLGVLLYELLTGTTPLEQARRQTMAFDETLRTIREEEPPKPSTRLSTAGTLPTIAANRGVAPAQLRRQITGDLDWIVMKCLEKDRNRRYETASSLANDVQHYLRQEPVQACPPSTRYRLSKFARRHRRMLAATLAFVLILVTAVMMLTVALVAVNREQQQKEAALVAEGKRRKQTRAALDTMSSLLIEDWLSKQTVMLPEHRRFLEQILRDYEEFAADTGQDEESRAGVAHAYGRVGAIRRRLGQRKDAETAWETSRDLYTHLVADFPKVPKYREGLARSYLGLGQLFNDKGQQHEAAAIEANGLSVYRELVAEFPHVADYRLGLAETLNTRGIFLKNLGRTSEAEETYGQAQDVLKQLVADFPDKAKYRQELAQTYLNLGLLLAIAGPSPEAEQVTRRAVDLYCELVASHPGDSRYLEWLAASRNNLGDIIRAVGRLPEAEQVFRESLTIRRQLVAESPAVPEYWRGLAMTLNNLGILLKDTNRALEAEDLYRQALAVHKRLAADYPTVTNHQNEVAGAMVNLARLLLTRNELIEARQLLEDATPYHHSALKANPNHPSYRRFYRINRWRMAEVLLALKDHSGAAEAAREFQKVELEPPRDAYTAAGLLAGCARLAANDERLGEDKRKELAAAYGDSAVAALRQAIVKGAKEVSQMANDSILDPLRTRQDFQKLLAEWEAKGKP
jgi:serine/threonine protein kinase/tetratricopeptide (TPR) repeat protein